MQVIGFDYRHEHKGHKQIKDDTKGNKEYAASEAVNLDQVLVHSQQAVSKRHGKQSRKTFLDALEVWGLPEYAACEKCIGAEDRDDSD